MMRIRVKISFKEYFKLNLWLMYKRPLTLLLMLISLLLLIFFSYLWIADESFKPEKELFPVVLPLIIFGFVPLMVYFKTRKYFKSNPHLLATVEYIITSYGLEINSDNHQVKYPWVKIAKAYESPSWFLLYTQQFTALCIPKNQLSNGQVMELNKMITQYTSYTKSLW